MKRLAYARVYNTAFKRGRARVNAWIQSELRPKRHTFHIRRSFVTHVQTMLRTQSIHQWIDNRTQEDIYRASRLSHIGCMMRLRVLQRCILQYVWRPGGRLMCENGKHIVA